LARREAPAVRANARWYSASKPAVEEDEEPPKKKAKKNKTKNPYSKPAPAAPASPTYQPASPGQYDAVEWPPAEEGEGEEEEEEAGEEEWQGYDGEYEHGAEADAEEVGQVFPAPAGQWPGGGSVGRDEAIGYALHAQYWAGYWMGIAAASGPASSETESGGEGAVARRRGKARPVNGLRR
jgi:hypothetical protein